MSCGLWVHDHRARPKPRDGVVKIQWPEGPPLHVARASRPIKVRTGEVYTYEGGRHIRNGNDNIPGMCPAMPSARPIDFFLVSAQWAATVRETV